MNLEMLIPLEEEGHGLYWTFCSNYHPRAVAYRVKSGTREIALYSDYTAAMQARNNLIGLNCEKPTSNSG